MKVIEYMSAEVHEDGSKTLEVRNHKTFYQFGEALVTLTKISSRMVECCYKYTRPFKISKSKICLASNGTKLTSMKYCIQKVWDKSV